MGKTSRFEVNRKIRGHVFYGDDLLTAPEFYETEDVPAPEKTIHARFFTAGGSQWLVAEYDEDSNCVFCYAILNGNMAFAEWGYTSLDELEGLHYVMSGLPIVVERDFNWTAKPFREIELP